MKLVGKFNVSRSDNSRFQNKLISIFFYFVFMSLPFFYPNRAFGQECLTVAPSYDILAGIQPEEMEDSDGPFYIKCYITVLRRSDKSGGPSESLFMSRFEATKSLFVSYNIFFYYGCINYIDDDYYYENPIIFYQNYQIVQDGLSIIIVPLAGGESDGIGALKIRTSYSSYTMAHEMGHALGLYHTFNGGKCANGDEYNERVDHSNSLTAGDYVYDTNAAPDPGDDDNSELFQYIDCEFINEGCADPIGTPYVNVQLDNIMAYGGCQDHFSPDQGEKMRKLLRYPAGVFRYAQRNWAYINTSSSISIPHYSDVDIVVAKGAECVINTTLNMAPITKIIVYPGAQLNIEDATIDVGEEDEQCPANDNLWRGIDLHNGDNLNEPSSHIFMEAQ